MIYLDNLMSRNNLHIGHEMRDCDKRYDLSRVITIIVRFTFE